MSTFPPFFAFQPVSPAHDTTPATPANPAASVDLDQPAEMQPAETADWPQRVREAHQRAFAQKLTLRVQPPSGMMNESVVIIQHDPAPAHSGDDFPPPNIRLRLGRQLILFVDSRGVSAFNPANPDIAWRSPDAMAPADVFKEVLPPILIPQLWWALTPPSVDELPLIGQVQWDEPVTREEETTLLAGRTDQGEVRLRMDAQTALVREFEALLRSREGETRYTLRAEALEREQEPVWPTDFATRRRVEHLTELTAKPPVIVVGDRVPGLGLMSSNLEAWSLASALQHPPGSIGVLVLWRDTPEGKPDALAGLRAGVQARKELALRAAERRADHREIHVWGVGVLEVGEVERARIDALTNSIQEEGAEILWTSAGETLLERLASGSRTLAIVVDHESRLVALVRLDGRRDDQAGTTAEFVRVIEAARGEDAK